MEDINFHSYECKHASQKQTARYVCISLQVFGSGLSVCASVSLFHCPSVTLLVCQFVGEFFGLSTCWPVCLSVCRSVGLSICFSFCPSIHKNSIVIVFFAHVFSLKKINIVTNSLFLRECMGKTF